VRAVASTGHQAHQKNQRSTRRKRCIGLIPTGIESFYDRRLRMSAMGGKLPVASAVFLVDELAQLGGLRLFKEAVTLLRGCGLRCCLFLQSHAQLRSLYPRDHETITENCGAFVTFGHTSIEHVKADRGLARRRFGGDAVWHDARANRDALRRSAHGHRPPRRLSRGRDLRGQVRREPAVSATRLPRCRLIPSAWGVKASPHRRCPAPRTLAPPRVAFVRIRSSETASPLCRRSRVAFVV